MNPIEAVKYIMANGRKDQKQILKFVLFLAGLYFFVIAPLHLYLLVTQ